MKKISINVVLNPKQLQQEMGRFRFRETDLSNIMEVNKRLYPLLRIEAFYEAGKADKAEEYIVLVTLGTEIDRLQEYYSSREMLFEAYVVECLGMIYLSRAYDKVFATMAVQEKGVLQKFYFWEEHHSMEELFPLLSQLTQTGIRCNQEGILKPSKSVVLIVRLKRDTLDSCFAQSGSSQIAQVMCESCTHKCERGKYGIY
jgi:hypothetical protein